MLRPANSLLGSSRAARRANINAERRKWLGQSLRSFAGVFAELFGSALDLLLLCGLPLLYLVSSYLVLDLPARWMTHRQPATAPGVLIFLAAIAVSAVALVRRAQGAPPVAPVRPRFAKAMLALGWIAALFFTVGDLVTQ
jgi:hypothetical protein